jgi:WD40 repeat protein
VTTSSDNTAKIWDAQTGKLIADLLGHASIVTSAAFSPDGNKIVTTSEDTTAKIWDAQTGKLIADFLEHKDIVRCAAFSPDGNKIVTVSANHKVKIWYTPEGIIEWLSTQNIYKLTQKDLENLGIDFIDLKEMS